MSNFPSSSINPYSAVPGGTYKFQGALLEADTAAQGETNTNKVATIGFVNNLISGSSAHPVVERAVNRPLGIVVSSGIIEHNGNTYTVPAKSSPISVVANSQEYVWFRFLDEDVVVSSAPPSSMDGVTIAKVTSNDAYITNIDQSTATFRWADVDSPSFIGEPKVPTAEAADDSLQIANTEWVNDRIEELRAEIMAQVLAEVKDNLVAAFGGEIVDK